MSTIYTCGRCGKALPGKSTKVCPHCHAVLSGIRCQHCGFVGSEKDFVNDRCPKCRSAVYVPRTQPQRAPAKPAKPWKPGVGWAILALVASFVIPFLTWIVCLRIIQKSESKVAKVIASVGLVFNILLSLAFLSLR